MTLQSPVLRFPVIRACRSESRLPAPNGRCPDQFAVKCKKVLQVLWEPIYREAMEATEPNTLIRAGVIEDLPVLIDVQRNASLAGYPEQLRTLFRSQPELIEQSFQKGWFAMDQVRVATQGPLIVGFAVLERSGDGEAEMIALFVDPAYWRRGIGKALVDAVAELAHRWGERRIFVLANPLALEFYRAAGFVHERFVEMLHAPAVPLLVRQIRGPLERPLEG